jgi:hypothetical protein
LKTNSSLWRSYFVMHTALIHHLALGYVAILNKSSTSSHPPKSVTPITGTTSLTRNTDVEVLISSQYPLQDFSYVQYLTYPPPPHRVLRGKKKNFGQDIRKGGRIPNALILQLIVVKDFWTASIFYPCQCMLQC